MPTVSELAIALQDRAHPTPPVSDFLARIDERDRARRSGPRMVAVLAVAAVLTAVAIPTWIFGGRSHSVGSKPATQVSSYRFTRATPVGTVIAPADRLPTGPVTGSLLGGGAFRLSDHRGSVVLLQYVASWCAPCLEQAAAANSVNRARSALTIVGVDIAEPRDPVQAWVDSAHLKYPIVLDPQTHTATELGGIPTSALPLSVFIDRQGRVAAVFLGKLSTTAIATTSSILQRE